MSQARVEISGGSVRAALVFVLVSLVVSGCLGTESAFELAKPVASIGKPPPSSSMPTAGPSDPPPPSKPLPSRPPQAPTPSEAPMAGPPFPTLDPGVVVHDMADLLTAGTEVLAAARIAEIATGQDTTIVVYTQYKPGSDPRSTERDAIALKVQLGMTDGLVIMWNTTRPDCIAGADGNGQVQLYAGSRYSATRLSLDDRQRIIDELMRPLLEECNEDDALLAALDGIAAEMRAPAPTQSGPPISGEGPCGDPEYELTGYRWRGTFEWFFQETSVPEDLDAEEVLEVVTRSAENITTGRNDCGLPDRIDATTRYMGISQLVPCESDFADGANVVGFGKLPPDMEDDTVAMVCTYGDDDDVVEADILIRPDISWALSEADCKGFQELLEPTITHEFGHVFGLGHVTERAHGDLTMSPTSNGACNDEESSLGLGDILGLEDLY